MFVRFPSQLKIFLKKFALFFLPFIIFFGFLEFLGIYSGELLPIKIIVERQTTEEDLLFARRVIFQDQHTYKYLSLIEKRPDIIALGSSRVMQMTEEMFNPRENFYNAGGIVQSMTDFKDFFGILPKDYNPEIIIISLDYFWLNDTYSSDRTLKKRIVSKDDAYKLPAHISVARHIVKESLKNPDYVIDIFKKREAFSGRKTIGLGALTGNGFPRDGSRQQAEQVLAMRENPEFVDREGPPVIDRVNQGLLQFVHGSQLNENKLEILKGFLTEAKNRNVEIVAFAPPFSNEVYDVLSQSENFKESFVVFQREIPKVFKEQNFVFYDFSNLNSLGLTDEYMFDGFHLTESGMGNLMQKILSSNAFPNGLLQADNLKKALQKDNSTAVEVAW